MERFEAKLDYLCSPRAKQGEFVCRTDHSGVKLPTCVPNKADLPAELTIRSSNSPTCVHREQIEADYLFKPTVRSGSSPCYVHHEQNKSSFSVEQTVSE